jgi:hypothetical protein
MTSPTRWVCVGMPLKTIEPPVRPVVQGGLTLDGSGGETGLESEPEFVNLRFAGNRQQATGALRILPGWRGAR